MKQIDYDMFSKRKKISVALASSVGTTIVDKESEKTSSAIYTSALNKHQEESSNKKKMGFT